MNGVLSRIEQFLGIGFSGIGWDPRWINGTGCWEDEGWWIWVWTKNLAT